MTHQPKHCLPNRAENPTWPGNNGGWCRCRRHMYWFRIFTVMLRCSGDIKHLNKTSEIVRNEGYMVKSFWIIMSGGCCIIVQQPKRNMSPLYLHCVRLSIIYIYTTYICIYIYVYIYIYPHSSYIQSLRAIPIGSRMLSQIFKLPSLDFVYDI